MDTFTKNTLNIYGKGGQTWLDNLPTLLQQCATHHGLSDLTPVENLSYNYVLTGIQEDKPIILKLSLDERGLAQETATLNAFSGFGAVTVLAQESGLLLLERAMPGESLKSYFPARDLEAVKIACALIERLHQAPLPDTGNFPHIKDWLKTLDNAWDIPAPYLIKARYLRDELFQTPVLETLLHGDIHHDNILKNGNDWIVIDPKGVIGDRTYETAAFIRNPMPDLRHDEKVEDLIHNRIAVFSQTLNIPPQRIQMWCFVQAVLAWAWALEDQCDAGYSKGLTEIFDKLSG